MQCRTQRSPRDTDAIQSREYTIVHSTFCIDARWAREARLVKDFPYQLNQVNQHFLVRHVIFNRFHRCRHQLTDVPYTFLVVLPSRFYCPCQQKVFIVCSFLQLGILNYGSQQTFRHILDIVRGSIHDEGLEPSGAWNSRAGTNTLGQLIQSLRHMSVLQRSLRRDIRGRLSRASKCTGLQIHLSLDFELI